MARDIGYERDRAQAYPWPGADESNKLGEFIAAERPAETTMPELLGGTAENTQEPDENMVAYAALREHILGEGPKPPTDVMLRIWQSGLFGRILDDADFQIGDGDQNQKFLAVHRELDALNELREQMRQPRPEKPSPTIRNNRGGRA